MAVSAVAAGASPQSNPYAEARQAFSQLSSALQSGNLTAAQSAYNTLASSPLAQSGPLASTLSEIGQDLQSGDISAAQQALTSLQQQMQAHKGHGHHHHGAKPADQSQSTTSTQSSDTDSGGDGSGAVSGVTASTGSNQSVNITA